LYIKYKRQRPTTTIVITVRRYFYPTTTVAFTPPPSPARTLLRYPPAITPSTPSSHQHTHLARIYTSIIIVIAVVVISTNSHSRKLQLSRAYTYLPIYRKTYTYTFVHLFPILPVTYDIAPKKNETMSNHTRITRRAAQIRRDPLTVGGGGEGTRYSRSTPPTPGAHTRHPLLPYYRRRTPAAAYM